MVDSEKLNETTRLSNFELLRIFAMFLIVMHHFSVHGIFSYWTGSATFLEKFNDVFCIFFASGGKIGVILFMLLTGYFNCNKGFSLKKVFSLCLKVFLVLYFVFIMCHIFKYEIIAPNVNFFLFPISHNTYWFVTMWLLVYIFSPLLNTIVVNLDKKYVRLYLLFSLLIWCVIPSFFVVNYYYSVLLYCFFIYLLGAALRLEIVKFNKDGILILFLLGLFFFVLKIVPLLHADKINLNEVTKYFDLQSIYAFTTAISIFYIFSNINIKYSKKINYIAASSFGVYLLHDNPFSRLLWHNFNVHRLVASQYFIFYYILISISIFAVCVVVDKILMFFCEKYIMGLSCFLDKKLSNLVKN